MADTVRFFLEEMVPELEDLEEMGYFSKAEIRDVVRKRENFEYALKRKTVFRADFLRYIEYETGLAELLRLRKAALGMNAMKGKGELGINKRCHLLYERATRKFKGDLQLWLSWLQFCKESASTRQVSRVLTKALQLHPTAAGLWSYAAAWEFEHNRSTAAARTLMQQGLRVCKADQQLWLEYFRLELVYLQKLHTRRKILGIQAEGAPQPEVEEVMKPGDAEGSAALDSVFTGAIAKLVFKEAIANIPDLPFRQRLLGALQTFTFPGVISIADDIYASIEADFGKSEEAWDARARRYHSSMAPPSETNPADAAEQIYEQAIHNVPSSRMFDLYSAYLLEQVDNVGGAVAGEASKEHSRTVLEGRKKKAAKRVLDLYQRAADAGVLSEKAALEWPEVALRCGRARAALTAAEKGTAMHPASIPLWLQRITLANQQAALQAVDDAGQARASVGALILEALEAVDGSSAADLWTLGLQTCKELGIPLASILAQLQRQLAAGSKGPVKGGMGQAAASAVQLVKEVDGINAARTLYRALLRLPIAGGALFHGVLDLELQEVEQRLSNPQLKVIFEAASDAYGKQDTELWLRYARFEQAEGQGVGGIYRRAIRQLDDPDAFVAQISQL